MRRVMPKPPYIGVPNVRIFRQELVVMPGTLEHATPDVSLAAAATETPAHADKRAADWSAVPGGVIHGGEIVLLAIKPSMWRPLIESGAWLACSAAFVLFLLVIGRPMPGLSLAMTLQLALFFGFSRLGVAVACWIPQWYILTNRRVIDIEGIRTPRIRSCPLLDVRNTLISSSTVERLTGSGTITIVPQDDMEPPRRWRCVTEHREVHARIRGAIEDAIDLHGSGA